MYYILYFFLDNLALFRMLFAPIIRSTTAAYSHRFCMVWCVYSIRAGTGFGTQPMAVRCSCAPDDGRKQHPKHVQLSCHERNKEYSTSSWTWIKHKVYFVAALVEAGVWQNKMLALAIMFQMMSLLVVQVLCDGLETTLNLILQPI
jgi:hypothetical protein